MRVLPVLVVALSYFLGSVPFGVILGSIWAGVDVRKFGSGNIGATNVLRTLGFPFAFATFLLDAAKGALPVYLARRAGAGPGMLALAGIAAVVGHNYPAFIRFRGGKGIATSWGFILSAMPQVGLVFAVVWIITVVLTRFASLGSILGAAATPLACIILHLPWQYTVACAILAVLAGVRHKSNIQRLRSGTENKFSLKTK